MSGVPEALVTPTGLLSVIGLFKLVENLGPARLRRLLRHAVRAAPRLALRLLNLAFSPKVHAQQLVLVACVQLLSVAFSSARRWLRRGVLKIDDAVWRQENARTFDQYQAATAELAAREGVFGPAVPASIRHETFFAVLEQRQDAYTRALAAGDEYGLMFHLRSELMRGQTGGAGYERAGSKWLLHHELARAKVTAYHKSVIEALRYIGSSNRPNASAPAQRLAFIQETRHSFGRTALLFSGGAAFGVKHIGVVAALHKEKLLPRIVCGSSAGSIVAAVVGVKKDRELDDLTVTIAPRLVSMRFFGLRRGASSSELNMQRRAADPDAAPDSPPRPRESPPRVARHTRGGGGPASPMVSPARRTPPRPAAVLRNPAEFHYRGTHGRPADPKWESRPPLETARRDRGSHLVKSLGGVSAR